MIKLSKTAKASNSNKLKLKEVAKIFFVHVAILFSVYKSYPEIQAVQ